MAFFDFICEECGEQAFECPHFEEVYQRLERKRKFVIKYMNALETKKPTNRHKDSCYCLTCSLVYNHKRPVINWDVELKTLVEEGE